MFEKNSLTLVGHYLKLMAYNITHLGSEVGLASPEDGEEMIAKAADTVKEAVAAGGTWDDLVESMKLLHQMSKTENPFQMDGIFWEHVRKQFETYESLRSNGDISQATPGLKKENARLLEELHSKIKSGNASENEISEYYALKAVGELPPGSTSATDTNKVVAPSGFQGDTEGWL